MDIKQYELIRRTAGISQNTSGIYIAEFNRFMIKLIITYIILNYNKKAKKEAVKHKFYSPFV